MLNTSDPSGKKEEVVSPDELSPEAQKAMQERMTIMRAMMQREQF